MKKEVDIFDAMSNLYSIDGSSGINYENIN